MSRGAIRSKRQEVFNKTSGKCIYCMATITLADFHIDHYYPFSKGGNNDIENLMPSCSKCNLLKSNKLVTEQVKTKVVTKVQTTDGAWKKIAENWQKIADDWQAIYELRRNQ